MSLSLPHRAKFFKALAWLFFGSLTLGLFGWAAIAVSIHLDGAARVAAYIGLSALSVTLFVSRIRSRRAGWAAFAMCSVLILGWYSTIEPLEMRTWDIDVSRGVKASQDGSVVTLIDIRDFDWINRDHAHPAWINASYDLDKIESIDMFTSVWDNPDIAHLLVSFGFQSGDNVVYSVEIRREEGEKFNQIGGFFRQFELVLIAATEEDIIKLRTNHRAEDVSLHSIDLSKEQMKTMFLAYVDLAQKLEKQPAFYNTITANCTTVVYSLAKSLKSDLPLDTRLILSGNLPHYLESLGVLGGEGPLEMRLQDAKITQKAQNADADLQFSDAIRAR